MGIVVSEIRKFNKSKTLKAFADVIIDNKVIIKNVKLLLFQGKLASKLPDYIGKDAKYHPVVLFKDNIMYEELTEILVEAYKKLDSTEEK